MVVKAITVLEKKSSSGDSYLSRHTSGFILSATLALLQGPVTEPEGSLGTGPVLLYREPLPLGEARADAP